jgi:hypothetical protein
MADAALGDIWTILCDYRQGNKRQRVDHNAAGPDATVRTGVEAGWEHLNVVTPEMLAPRVPQQGYQFMLGSETKENVRVKNLSIFSEPHQKVIGKGRGNRDILNSTAHFNSKVAPALHAHGVDVKKFCTAAVAAKEKCALLNADYLPRLHTPAGVVPPRNNMVGVCGPGHACYRDTDSTTKYVDPDEGARLQTQHRDEVAELKRWTVQLESALVDAKEQQDGGGGLGQFARDLVSTWYLQLAGVCYIIVLIEHYDHGDKDCHEHILIVLVDLDPDYIIPFDMMCLLNKYKKVKGLWVRHVYLFADCLGANFTPPGPHRCRKLKGAKQCSSSSLQGPRLAISASVPSSASRRSRTSARAHGCLSSVLKISWRRALLPSSVAVAPGLSL